MQYLSTDYKLKIYTINPKATTKVTYNKEDKME